MSDSEKKIKTCKDDESSLDSDQRKTTNYIFIIIHPNEEYKDDESDSSSDSEVFRKK